MLLSIIMVSYNESSFLAEAINSCLSIRDVDNFEIIVGDDGSSDNSLEIIKNYAKKYPHIISYFVMDRDAIQPVIGSIRASNVIKRGLETARGNYCYVISGDDYICDGNFFSNAIDILNKHPKCSSVIAQKYKLIWPDKTEKLVSNKRFCPVLYWSGAYNHISSFVFRKEIAKKNLLDRFCDDTGLEYSLLGKMHTWKYINCSSFYYRQRDKSIMHDSDPLELALLEIMLFQDCLNKINTCNKVYTLSRFSSSLIRVFKLRKLLDNAKYAKYINNCENLENNFLKEISDYDTESVIEKIKMNFFLIYTFFLSFMFKVIRKIIL